jgi:predicted GNAT family acetyltransferase
MKIYKKLHESKEVANIHIAKIKERGGDVKKSIQNGKILLEYSFPYEISSKYSLSYSKKISDKGKTFYDVINNGIRIGMVEFHPITNKYIEIDRIYLDKNHQKQGFGQKIIYDILAHTNSNGFILYPLEQSVWVKMGLSFIEGKYPYMIISKKDFINKNSKKL